MKVLICRILILLISFFYVSGSMPFSHKTTYTAIPYTAKKDLSLSLKNNKINASSPPDSFFIAHHALLCYTP